MNLDCCRGVDLRFIIIRNIWVMWPRCMRIFTQDQGKDIRSLAAYVSLLIAGLSTMLEVEEGPCLSNRTLGLKWLFAVLFTMTYSIILPKARLEMYMRKCNNTSVELIKSIMLIIILFYFDFISPSHPFISCMVVNWVEIFILMYGRSKPVSSQTNNTLVHTIISLS